VTREIGGGTVKRMIFLLRNEKPLNRESNRV
jgi:hypothetical protein